jgi:hypothetical protein
MNEGLAALLAELAKVHAPVTEEELAQARAEWPDRSEFSVRGSVPTDRT